MIKVRRIRVFSLAKVTGCLYGGLGLIFGAIFALISLTGSLAGLMAAGQIEGDAPLGIFGAGAASAIGALILLPLVYGVAGFILGIIVALLYNLVAASVGGIELETE